MQTFWAVAVLLASSLTAAAQDTISANLLDGKLPAALAAEEDAAQGKQDETRTVTSDKLQDELPVGPYKRPMWTLHRVSPTTRIYLQVDPGEVEFEQWLDIRMKKDRSGNPDDRVRMSQEFEFGLGGRWQLDLYYNTIFTRHPDGNSGSTSTLSIRSWAAELRYALADWGVIPGNPTLYLEYIMWNNQPDGHGDEATGSIEPKLLLGGEIAPGWHWGTNFFYEHTFNDSVMEVGATASLLHTVIDTLLTIGLTTKYIYESAEVTGGVQERSRELYIGPTLQFRMASIDQEMEVNGVKTKLKRAKAHLDLEPILGCTGDSSRVQFLIVFGWTF